MADYIDKDAAIARVKKQMNREFTFGPWAWNDKIANVCYGIVIEALERLPSADVKPIVHGRWEPYEFGDDHWHKCPVCGKADEYISHYGLEAVRNFCPNCGADMREVDT